MRKEESFWKKLAKWFTVSRVLITCWNTIAFCYHFFVIGFDSQTSIVIQVTALITEYLVSGPYERMLLWSNKKINATILEIPFVEELFIKFFTKVITFTLIFALVYHSTYYLRLQAFQLIDFGVDAQQLMKTMINMVWFTSIAGPIMGFLVIWRKKKKHEQLVHKAFIRNIRWDPSVCEGFFYIIQEIRGSTWFKSPKGKRVSEEYYAPMCFLYEVQE